MNILEPILYHAKGQPAAPALCAPGGDIVSYARLRTQMNNVAGRAAACGLRPGAVVALSIDQPLLHAAVILGLTQAGMVPVSVAMQKPPERMQIDAVISNTDYPFAAHARRLPLDFSWIMGDGAPAELSAVGAAASDRICRVVLTSGTTGDAKAIALTHRLVMARNARFEHVFGHRYPTFSRVYLHMGLAAALGYQFLIHILGRGGTIFLRGNSIESTLQAFELFRIEAILGTPTTLARLLTQCDRYPAIACHVDTVLSGGSLMPPPLADRIRPRLCAHLITGYGATETAISATAPAHTIAHVPGAAGYVLPGTRIEIVDEADRPLPPGVEGIVRVNSEFAVDRYIDDDAETAKVFRDGWFYPGDIGSLTAENLLVISGRQDSVLNAGGDKITAEKIEAAITSFATVGEAAVVMATNRDGIEEIWAAVVAAGKIDAEALRRHCRSRVPPPFVPARVVRLETLPTNALGKVDRQKLKELLAAAAPI
jgi:acyl-CoA synthetase (AMP-forming)/AMP-acid ligase II